jgi:hypothetical protein
VVEASITLQFKRLTTMYLRTRELLAIMENALKQMH